MTASMRPVQQATGPTNTASVNDIEAGKEKLDQWIRKITRGAIGWTAVNAAGSVIPGVGTVFAAVDAIGDLLTLIDGNQNDFLTWVSFGINVVGLVSFPGVGPARLTIRTTLAAVRRNGIALISDALLSALEKNLNDKTRGSLEAFAQAIESRLNELLTKIAAEIKKACTSFAQMLRGVASEQGQKALAKKTKKASILFGPVVAIGAHFLIEDRLLSPDTCQQLLKAASLAEQIGRNASAKILGMADPGTVGSIGYLVLSLANALRNRKRRGPVAAVSHNDKPSRAQHVQGQGGLTTRGTERPPVKDSNCRNVAPNGTGSNISFATGSESFTHTDFSLPGCFPIEWARTYRSSLSALDEGPLGARWMLPYSIFMECVGESGIAYRDADGRSHHYPNPAVGKHNYDAVEDILLIRPSDCELIVARGHDIQEHFHKQGETYRLTTIKHRNGACVALHYEHLFNGKPVLSDLLTYQEERQQHHIHLEPSGTGHIRSVWLMKDGAPLRQLAAYEHDNNGDLVSAQDENAAQWAYTYHNHLITRYTDRTGRGLNLGWNGEGPDAKAIREWGDDGSFETRLEWDPNIRLTYVTDAQGQETWHYYDILGFTYRIVYPDGNEEWFYRDEAKNVVQHIHTDGSTEQFAYDERGNLLQHTRADGTSVHHAYDDQGQRFKTRDAEGGLWKYDYDQRGNIIETQDPLENKTQYAYNNDNLPIAIVDANGGERKLAYNRDSQLVSYTDCSGKTTQWQYDNHGKLNKLINAAGEVTEYLYEAGQLTQLVHPDKTKERFERDAEGRLLKHTDALNRSTSWAYNEAGLIHQRLNANDTTLTYHWDKLGQLVRLRNENNSEANFKYDPVGRLLKETGFDKETIHYLYDHGSHLPTRRVDGDRTTHFEYDPMGRLIERKAARRGGETWEIETFAYDGNGSLIWAENGMCALQWFYDAAGNNIREHQFLNYLAKPQLAIFKHEYDALNQRVATTRPDGHRVSWLTYGSGHLLALKLDDVELLSYERDDLHREVGRVQGNGLIQRQSWSPNGQLLEQTLVRQGETRRLVARNYRYDEAGQLTHINDLNRGDTRYRYDPVGRLLEADVNYVKETFAFDPASNLLDPDAPPGPNPHSPRKLMDNVLRSYCGTEYRYDERGNLLERIEDGKSGKFTWDLYDRLRRYEDDRLVVEFGYDALGRRVYKDSHSKYRNRVQAGPVWNENAKRALDEQLGCDLTLFVWDGDTLAFEQKGRDGKGRTTHYVFEPGTFVPIAQGVVEQIEEMLHQRSHDFLDALNRIPVCKERSTPKQLDAFGWYHSNHLGTPVEITGHDGIIRWLGNYTAWGLIKENRNSHEESFPQPLRFQGQYFDVEISCSYNRFRYYSPNTGRFIGKDPIGYAGGLNTYCYTHNPNQWIDPLGLTKTSSINGRKPHSSKPNQNSSTPCRNPWQMQRYNRVCEGAINGTKAKYFRDPDTQLWWSRDTESHGGSNWKVMRQLGDQLIHQKDADIYGDYMEGKHKGPTGEKLNLKGMRCKDT
ncbi:MULTISPECIES: RHS repeat-associated core domain-containing protein [Pseudomonas]|uniref:RHS repeat-associated core domain-containing protein n=2 Tax=Pseudomonas TaxID=286 RepID=UPI001F2E7259|nr:MULTISPECIES: RHS repeat-associated core domain-containing protein [Pseudomonas]MDI3374754.1 RHS repeat-associated core domain-containing protein [Pseudomonas sp. V104_6]